jgi:hypothetical protein
MARIKTLLAAMAVFVCISASAHAAVKAALMNVAGDVKMQKSASAEWVKAADGNVLEEGSRVKTGADGQAVIKMGNGHVVKIFPMSNVGTDSLQSSDNGSQKISLSVKEGRVMTKVSKLTTPDSSFSVKTPTGVAGVRGTAFDCAIPPGGGSMTLAVVDGAVAINVGGAEVVVGAGFELSVADGATPGTPTKIPESKLQELKSAANSLQQISAGGSGEAGGGGGGGGGGADAAQDSVMNSVLDGSTITNSISDAAAEAAGCPMDGGCMNVIVDFEQ